MIGDPLTDMLKRSVGAPVADARSEIVRADDEVRLERIHFTSGGEARTLVLKRVPKDRALEVQLLPFLARKTDRVPRLYARGIPPPAVPAWPWVLIEDVVDLPGECGDLAAVLAAKAAIEAAVARDAPALRALGVPGSGPALVHGDLGCDHAKRTERGVVLVDWSHARFGDPADDVARITRSIEERRAR